MSRTHYFYFQESVLELEKVVEAHKESFNLLIEDNFSDEELLPHEKTLDSIAAVFVQPILSELTFDDFTADPKNENEQRTFFDNCRSSICLEYLPEFQNNPFQVTYLQMLLSTFQEILVDQGGVKELVFKKTYVENLKKYRTIDSLYAPLTEKIIEVKKSSAPVTPVDFLLAAINKEWLRLEVSGKTSVVSLAMKEQSEKLQKIFAAFEIEKQDAGVIFKKSGLIAKDFEDNLERLKFLLKKI